jgi:3-oxoacyl-[acyl-carrier-protein] synthase-3
MITRVAGTGIVAMGAYAPPDSTIVRNEVVAARAGITVDRIEAKTGIHERRHSPSGTRTSTLAALAVEDLRTRYPRALDSVGTLIVATSTKDQPIPHTASFVHRALGLPPIKTFDVDAVCTGFIQAVDIAVGMYDRTRHGGDILVIGVDRYPAIIDPADGLTAALFGEAAGAVVISAVSSGHGVRAIATVTHSEYAELVQVEGGGTCRPLDEEALARGLDRFRMAGRQVREYAFGELPRLVHEVIDEAGVTIRQVRRLIAHQAHPVLVRGLAVQLGIPEEKAAITADRFGNTGCGSIPFTLVGSNEREPLSPGDIVLLASIGGGMTVGAAVLVWG